MIRKVLVGSIAAMAALLMITGCSNTVQENQVEEAIKTNLGPQISAPIDEVDCPENLKGEVGQKTVCTMTVQGQQVQVEVTVTSVEGKTVNFDMKTV